MLWWSSHESIQEERISVLAVLETFLAIGLAIGIYFYSGSLVHIAASAALAPFLLLRTTKSTKQGIEIASNTMNWIWDTAGPPLNSIEKPYTNPYIRRPLFALSAISLGFLFFAEIVIVIALKIAIAVHNFLMHPLGSLGAIPRNWRRVVLCTDTATAPEIIPGIAQYNPSGTIHADGEP